MNRVLVIGGGGFVGGALVKQLVEQGVEPTIFALRRSDWGANLRWVLGDRGRLDHIEALAACGFDTVFDLVAYCGAETRSMVDLWRGRIERFVHLSTIAVYQGTRTLPITEDTAIRQPGSDDGYGAGKAESEEVLEAAARDGFPAVIMRSALLFGAGDQISRENFFLKRLIARRPLLVPGSAQGALCLLDVEDLATALVAAARAPVAAGRCYHVSLRERVTLQGHIEAIAAIAGLPAEIREIPPAVLERSGINPFAFPFFPLQPNAWLDVGRAALELSFQARPYAESIERTVRWLRDDSAVLPAWPGRNAVQTRLVGTHEWIYTDIERQFNVEGSTVAEALPRSELMRAIAGWRDNLSFAPADEAHVGGQVLFPSSISPWMPASSTPHRFGAPLEAVIEIDKDREQTGWLFARSDAARARGYRGSNRPARLRFVRFSEFAEDDKSLVGVDAQILAIIDSEDEAAALEWVAKSCSGSAFRIASPRRCARTYLARAADWVSFACDQRLGFPVEGSLLRRLAVFDVCRLLITSVALPEDETVVVDFDPPPRILEHRFSLGVRWGKERRAFLCDLRRGELSDLTVSSSGGEQRPR